MKRASLIMTTVQKQHMALSIKLGLIGLLVRHCVHREFVLMVGELTDIDEAFPNEPPYPTAPPLCTCTCVWICIRLCSYTCAYYWLEPCPSSYQNWRIDCKTSCSALLCCHPSGQKPECMFMGVFMCVSAWALSFNKSKPQASSNRLHFSPYHSPLRCQSHQSCSSITFSGQSERP